MLILRPHPGLETNYTYVDQRGSQEPLLLSDAGGQATPIQGVSPDHTGLLVYSRTVDTNAEIYATTNLDGTVRRELTQPLPSHQWARWVTDNGFVIANRPEGFSFPPMLDVVAILDNETSLARSVQGVELSADFFAISPDTRNAITVDDFGRLVHTNFESGQSHWIEPLVGDQTISGANGIALRWSESGISIAAMDENRLSLVREVSLDDLLAGRFRPFVIDLGDDADGWWIDWLSLDESERLIFSRLNPASGEGDLYSIDTTSNELRSYCLATKGMPRLWHASAHGDYVAWAQGGVIGGEDLPPGTILLNIQTGQRTFIPDVQPVTWLRR